MILPVVNMVNIHDAIVINYITCLKSGVRTRGYSLESYIKKLEDNEDR